MKKKDVIIWVWDEHLASHRVRKVVKPYGGIAAFGPNAKEFAEELDLAEKKNLYLYTNDSPDIAMRYLGEFGTRRIDIPEFLAKPQYRDTLYADESSPFRLKYLPWFVKLLSYSSYRLTLFTIPLVKTDINIRLPILSPVFTLKRLHKLYGDKFCWIWIDLKKNLYFCYPYKTLLDPSAVKKDWSFKPFWKIPFDWHIKAMIRFAEKYNKKVFIYAGDYDVSKEEFLQRMKILDKYFE